MPDTKALFTQRFDAARTAWTAGDEPAAAESLHWAIATARSDPGLRKELASALYNLGKLSRKFGKAGEVEAGPLLIEALTISEELFGRHDAALVPVLHELSRLHLQQSQHARAQETLEHLLAIARTKGEEHPDVATALSDLAFVKRKLGDDASAEALYRDALRIRERVLEPNHTATVGTIERLSETCAARGNFVEALALLQRALPTREAALGPGHERVRAARSRAAEFELQIAIAADTAAAAEARTKDAKPTPVWLKRVPESPADTPSGHVPSPVSSHELQLLGQSEPLVLRPPLRPRDRAMTPTVAAAVAVASLLASSMKTPSASQLVISPPESAGLSGALSGRETGPGQRAVVLAEVESAPADWRSAVAVTASGLPEPARKKKTVLYAVGGLAAAAVTIAALLVSRPRVSSDVNAAQPNATAAASSAKTQATTGAVTTVAAAAIVGAPHADSLRAAPAIATPAPAAAAVKTEQRAPENVPAEPRVPTVDIHVGAVDLPSMPAALSVDSLVRATERQRSADTARPLTKYEAPVSETADVDEPHTAPKIKGRAPEPGFPDALLGSGTHDGTVVVRFMVNALGRVNVASMIVERTDNELFTAAVRDILLDFRFEPARTRGPQPRAVAAWVSVPFRFTTKKR